MVTDNSKSDFIKVHDNRIIPYKKHLYITATKRIFIKISKKRSSEINAVLISMDEKKFYGKRLHHYTFIEAVDNELLTPYKTIIILDIDDKFITPAIQNIIANKNCKLDFDDAVKIIGCHRALTKTDKEVRDGITKDVGVKKFLSAYPGEIITKKYLSLCLQSLTFKEYYACYANNFSQELPHIPCVKSAKNFGIFVYYWIRTLPFVCEL
ncbi:hypothetical protein [Bartonella henselae]|uniref:hypothetical protein n=1 Tax=Bartonella henselae TaxID=38323 RepID=UPI000962255D|nr:hypothetical protein [Bartonella henselae]OLL54411.1 hypothetical protein AT238_00010 [Bartonella henselae]